MRKSGVDADTLRHVSQGHAMQAMLGEQVFRSVEDLLERLGPLFRLAARDPLGRGTF
jgi:hypothetical protein